MTSHDAAYAAGYVLGQLFVQVALFVVAVAVLIAGIIVAIRTKNVALRVCAIFAAIAGLSLLGLATSAFNIGIIGDLRPKTAGSRPAAGCRVVEFLMSNFRREPGSANF